MLNYITDEELERIRKRACDGKKKYLSKETAENVIKTWRASKQYRKARHMKNLHAYLCPSGGHWHVGHSTYTPKDGTDQ